MAGRLDARRILIISGAAAVLTLLPYLLANQLAPAGTRFTGFLINPVDGFSYLAKMRQGAAGSWFFTLPYAARPGPGALLFIYYLFLGHLAAWSGLPLLAVYQAARILNAFATFVLAYVLLDWAVEERTAVRFGWALVLCGAGLGWISTLFGHPASDMLIPESIPFLGAFSNPHFPLAMAATLAAVLAVALPGGKTAVRTGVALAAGLVLGAVLPFAAVVPFLVLGLWVGANLLRRERAGGGALGYRPLLSFLGFGVGLAPWAVYDLWLSRAYPMLAAWNAQNQTPSPPPWDYALGFGVVLALAVVGLWWRKTTKPAKTLLLLWAGLGLLLLYAPLAFQRRLSLGLFFPLSALAALGLLQLGAHGAKVRTVAMLAVALAVPSNLLVVGAGVLGAASGDPVFVYTEPELEAYDWLGEHAPPGALVLASSRTGNRLPALLEVRVLYGHPFETPDAERALATVQALFSTASTVDGREQLHDLGVEYVFYGPAERALGHPAWLEGWIPVAVFDGIELYRVP